MAVLHSRAGIVAMAPSPSRMALGGTQFIASATNGQREGRAPARPLLRCRFRSRQARPSRATHDGGAHPSCDRLRGSLRSGDMSLRCASRHIRSQQVRPSRAMHDGGAHPSCDRLRGSLRSGDMSLRCASRHIRSQQVRPSRAMHDGEFRRFRNASLPPLGHAAAICYTT